MDDWPRVTNLFHSKYNIDASAWMYFFAMKMSYIAEKISDYAKQTYY